MDEDRKLMESLRRTLYGESSSFRSPSNSEDLSSHPWPPLQPSLAMEEEFKWETENDAFPTIDASLPDSNENSGAEVAATSAATPAELRRRTKKPWQCSHCAVEKTPLKREGPEGPATLCNACGIRFRAGGLVPEYRPANSPTFSIERHSNLKEVLEEMREKSCSSSQDNSFTK